MSGTTDFTVQFARHGDTLRWTVAGEFDLATEPVLVTSMSAALAARDASHIVLDLVGVGFIDSSGLRTLLQSRDTCNAQGLRFSLVVTDGPVSRLLDLTGVREWFTYEPAAPARTRPAPAQALPAAAHGPGEAPDRRG